LLGYNPHGRSYRVYNFEINIVVVSCDVTFNETAPCPRSVFECAGNKEIEESIFVDERLGDELTQKHNYIDANQEFTTDPRRSPPSLPHLIGNENVFLAHFYTTNARMKLGSGKEPQPSRVLYTGPSKRLNDYYAPRA
jgi:hypothetical protein